MKRKEFVNRKMELESLGKSCSRDGFEFIVITGRRRVGKTRLLQEFSKDQDNIFLMCEERKWEYNLDKFNKRIGNYYDMPEPNYRSFRDCFEFITGHDDKPLVIIDEYSYLRKNKDILGEFQGIVDEILGESDMKLILSGSAVTMMKRDVLGSHSPLYGRTTSQLNVQPLRFSNVISWFDGVDIIDIIKIFGVCDGIPKYLEFFRGEDVTEEIKQNLFNPDAFLFREPKLLLEEELREPVTYHQILEAISLGHTKVTDIANYSYMEAKDLASYLSRLIDLGFVERERSILDTKRKRSVYRIKDNLFKFWFRFVSPHFAEIESWNMNWAVEEFDGYFDQYLGGVFERVCRQFLESQNRYSTIGRWWYKEDEIDIVAISNRENNILFGECKWSDNKVDRSVLYHLIEKSSKVKWRIDDRCEEFAIFSKNGFSDRLEQIALDNDRIHLYSINDIFNKSK